MRQVDFIMAYLQAPIKMDMYMELPPGIHATLGDSRDYILMLPQKQVADILVPSVTPLRDDIGGMS